MYRLTDQRLAKAKHLLEEYRGKLAEHGRFNVTTLDHELKQLWDIGYQELKDVIEDMYKKHSRYQYVAVYYMEHSNDTGVVSEFQPLLANAYGLEDYYDGEREASQKLFWENARKDLQSGTE